MLVKKYHVMDYYDGPLQCSFVTDTGAEGLVLTVMNKDLPGMEYPGVAVILSELDKKEYAEGKRDLRSLFTQNQIYSIDMFDAHGELVPISQISEDAFPCPGFMHSSSTNPPHWDIPDFSWDDESCQ